MSAFEEYAELSDYRTFNEVCSATTGRQGDGDPSHEIVLHVQSIDTTQPIPRIDVRTTGFPRVVEGSESDVLVCGATRKRVSRLVSVDLGQAGTLLEVE